MRRPIDSRYEDRFLVMLSILAAFILAVAILFYVTTARASSSCPTLREARHLYPDIHLWRDRDDCWGTRRGRYHHRHYEAPPDAHGNKVKVVDWNEFNEIDAQADNPVIFAPWEDRIGGVFKR